MFSSNEVKVYINKHRYHVLPNDNYRPNPFYYNTVMCNNTTMSLMGGVQDEYDNIKLYLYKGEDDLYRCQVTFESLDIRMSYHRYFNKETKLDEILLFGFKCWNTSRNFDTPVYGISDITKEERLF